MITHDELIKGVHYFTDRHEYPFPECHAIPATRSREKYRQGKAELERLGAAARLEAKLDRAAELMGRVTARRAQPVRAQVPGPAEMAAQWQAGYAAREAQICAEAKAAYDARNPHKRKEGTA